MNIQYASMLRTASRKKLSEGFPFFQQLRNFKQRNIIFLFNSSSNLCQITKYIQFSLDRICYVQPATEFLHFTVHELLMTATKFTRLQLTRLGCNASVKAQNHPRTNKWTAGDQGQLAAGNNQQSY